MKTVKIIFSVTIVTLMLAGFAAAGPDISFEEKDINFGTVQGGEQPTGIFKFKNNGDADLILTRVHATCGCTAVQVNREPIKPGKTGEIKAVLNTAGYRNKMVKYIYVDTNVPHMPRITLSLSTKIIYDIDIKPNSYLAFYNIKKDQVVSKSLDIVNNTTEPLKLSDPIMSGDKPDAFTYKLETIEPGKIFKLNVNFKAGKPGSYAARLKLKTNKTKKPEIVIPFSAAVKEDVYPLPNAIIIRRNNPNEPRFKTIKIMNSTEEDLKVDVVKADSKFINYKIAPIKGSQNYRLTVSLKRDAPKEVIRGKITLKTNNKSNPKLVIRYYVGAQK